MNLNFESEKPIYLQLAELIEDAVLSGSFPEESQIPSTTEISVTYKINPATALKGINLLVEQGVIYKKRGVGMFVSSGSIEKLQQKHKSDFLTTYVDNLITEAKKLSITKEDIILMIERGFDKWIT